MSIDKTTIYRGDTFKGTINLRLVDACDPNKVSPFAIEAGSDIEVRFPGDSGAVVLSTDNVGEITIVDDALSTITFIGAPAKSAVMKKGDNQSVTVVVTQGISGEVVTFEKAKYLNIKDRAN